MVAIRMEHAEVSQKARDAQYERPEWASNPYQPPQDLGDKTQAAINTFMYSKQDDGCIGGLGWGWQTPNGFTAMALHDLWSRSNGNYNDLAWALKTTESNHSKLVNEFNDDTLWWALCCVHIGNIAGDPWFFERAKDIYQHMQRSVCRKGQIWFRGRDMEGACYWTIRDGEEAINTVTTGLYAELCCRLALLEHGRADRNAGYSHYIEAARCSLAWILRCRYRDGIILDSIMLNKDEEVDWTFTYTTGIAMGVCALMYELLGQPEYLELALHIANMAMRKNTWVTSDGVLLEWEAYGHGKHDPWQNSDGIGFKAVLMRQFGTLYDVLIRLQPQHGKGMETANLIRTFVNVNFQSQQDRNTNGQGQYGPWWKGPFECPTSHSQMAALDVMAVVRLVNQR